MKNKGVGTGGKCHKSTVPILHHLGSIPEALIRVVALQD